MKTQKLKELLAVVASGVTGAIVLNGTCLFLYLTGFFNPAPFSAQREPYLSFEQIVIYAGLIGFGLGVVFLRRFLTWKRGSALVLIFSLPPILLAWLGYYIGQHIAIPYHVKLADCTNNITTIQFKAPAGCEHQFHLLTPEAQIAKPNGAIVSSYKLSGHAQIFQGTSNIADLPLCPDVRFTREGFILAGMDSHSTTKWLGGFIQPKQDYTIQITLDPPPPPASSFWLYYQQTKADRRK